MKSSWNRVPNAAYLEELLKGRPTEAEYKRMYEGTFTEAKEQEDEVSTRRAEREAMRRRPRPRRHLRLL